MLFTMIVLRLLHFITWSADESLLILFKFLFSFVFSSWYFYMVKNNFYRTFPKQRLKPILLRLFWNEISPSLTDWKTFESLTESFFDENARNFQELLFKVWGTECWFSFFSKWVTVRVEKINDRWRYYRQQKNAQKGWN